MVLGGCRSFHVLVNTSIQITIDHIKLSAALTHGIVKKKKGSTVLFISLKAGQH